MAHFTELSKALEPVEKLSTGAIDGTEPDQKDQKDQNRALGIQSGARKRHQGVFDALGRSRQPVVPRALTYRLTMQLNEYSPSPWLDHAQRTRAQRSLEAAPIGA